MILWEIFDTSKVEFWGFVISIIALVSSFVIFKLNSNHNKRLLFNDLVGKFFEIAGKLTEHQKNNSEAYWDALLFNTIEHISYMSNKDNYIRKMTIEFLGDAFTTFKGHLKKYYSNDYNNQKKYEEWRKLDRKIQKWKKENP